LDLRVRESKEMSRDELIALAWRQDGQITTLSTQVADLVEANGQLAAKLAKLEHLLARNSGNSSMPPSKDDEPGKIPPAAKKRRGGPKRPKGKQPGAPGARARFTPTRTGRPRSPRRSAR
jgi:hypothetical protein